MSGIAGIIHLDGQPLDPARIEAMTATMAHRGPDGIGHWHSAQAALGQLWRHTTPECPEDTQPLSSPCGRWTLVMDGRVDNADDLRRRLPDGEATLRGRPDTELVLAAFRHWGTDALQHIDGDFALAIWDNAQRELFCARDRMGNKPFFWHSDGRRVMFASEPQAVLQQAPAARILDEGVLAEYLAADWMSFTDTLWQGLKRLAPAHWLRVSADGMSSHHYWVPDTAQRQICRNDDEYQEAYFSLFSDIVRQLSRSGHPVAVEVSGGLDSSAVFATADHLRRQGQVRCPDLWGYTLCFAGDQAADESAYSRAVASHTGRVVHEVTPEPMPWGWYRERAARYADFPDFPNGAAMAQPLARTAASHGARALLTGLGGDQWLCGSPLQVADSLQAADWQQLGRWWTDTTRQQGRKRAAWELLRYGLVPALPGSWRLQLRRWRDSLNLGDVAGDVDTLSAALRHKLHARRQQVHLPTMPAATRPAQRGQLAGLYDAYQIMAIEQRERELARHGLEMRQPFWNARMAQFALATPEHIRLREGTDKWLHRQAMARHHLLPRQVLERQDKAEFSTLYAQSLRQLDVAHCRSMLQRRTAWIDPQRMEQAAQSFSSSDRQTWNMHAAWSLWALLGIDLVAP